MSSPFPHLRILLATQPNQTFPNMLPRHLHLSLEHNFVDMLVHFKRLPNNFFILARIKIANHVKEFSNIGDDEGVGFLYCVEEL